MRCQTLIDGYSLKYPGIESVGHVYFHAVHGADDARRREYLARAYALGREFMLPKPATVGAALHA